MQIIQIEMVVAVAVGGLSFVTWPGITTVLRHAYPSSFWSHTLIPPPICRKAVGPVPLFHEWVVCIHSHPPQWPRWAERSSPQ